MALNGLNIIINGCTRSHKLDADFTATNLPLQSNFSSMTSLGFIDPPPPKFRSPLDTKAPGPPLIYLVRPSAISDPHINICVRPPNTCVALKQLNLLPPNTLF